MIGIKFWGFIKNLSLFFPIISTLKNRIEDISLGLALRHFYVLCFMRFIVKNLETIEKYKQENKILLQQLIINVSFVFW